MLDAEVGARVRGHGAPHSIWTFLAFDSTSFGIFFFAFMLERSAQPAAFDQSARLLDPRLGLLNTAILITSSWLVASGWRAGRDGFAGPARRYLIWAIVVASAFAVIKIAEYIDKIGAGINIVSDGFFTFYFTLTGVHLLHYAIGLAVLTILARNAKRIDATGEEQERYLSWLEGGALYWHLVDVLWIFLFSMLYLLPGR